MITEDLLRKRFSEILAHLPESVRASLRTVWYRDLPEIITDPIRARIKMKTPPKTACTKGYFHIYNLDNITPEILDDVIMHEIVHDYRKADLRDGPGKLWNGDERETVEEAQAWIRRYLPAIEKPHP